MQTQEDSEPSVRIRELKPDRVDFVLENVDLACVVHHDSELAFPAEGSDSLANSIRRVVMADLPTVGTSLDLISITSHDLHAGSDRYG